MTLTMIDDDDYCRKTDTSVIAKLLEKISFDNGMLLISEMGILKINDFNLDVCSKRVAIDMNYFHVIYIIY